MSHLQYKKSYCKKLIDHMSQGKSFETFAAIANVHRTTLYEWVKMFPEFADAKDLGEAKAKNLFESLLILKMTGKKKDIDLGAVIFALKTRFHKTYNNPEKHEVKEISEEDNNITVTFVDPEPPKQIESKE